MMNPPAQLVMCAVTPLSLDEYNTNFHCITQQHDDDVSTMTIITMTLLLLLLLLLFKHLIIIV
jgi:hypothetical protein